MLATVGVLLAIAALCAFLLLQLAQRCKHLDYSLPRSVRGGHYVVCLRCFRDLAYDWHAMRLDPTRYVTRGRIVEVRKRLR
jgi:hypothetical protein